MQTKLVFEFKTKSANTIENFWMLKTKSCNFTIESFAFKKKIKWFKPVVNNLILMKANCNNLNLKKFVSLPD